MSLKKLDKHISALYRLITLSNTASLMGCLCIGEGCRTGCHALDNSSNPLLNEEFNPRCVQRTTGQEMGGVTLEQDCDSTPQAKVKRWGHECSTGGR